MAERISDGSCCICLELIQNETQASCGHCFCAGCILELWNINGQMTASCPLCRLPINMLYPNFRDDGTDELKNDLTGIHRYNTLHGANRSFKEILYDAPYLIKRIFTHIFTLKFIICQAFCWIFLLICAAVYILSPADIISEGDEEEGGYGILGLIDDIFTIISVLVYISNAYYRHLQDQSRNGYNN